jgi:hypothetical protein
MMRLCADARFSFPVSALSLALCAALSATAGAATIRVPAEQPTLQDGINAAAVGDTILVASGTYSGLGNQDLSFLGKDLALISELGPEQTAIQLPAGPAARGFFLVSAGPAALVAGFTVRGGDATSASPAAGGAALLVNSSLTFRRCVFVENRAGNSLGAGGGAVACLGSSPHFEECLFTGNTVEGPGAVGGAVAIYGPSDAYFGDCRFENNSAVATLPSSSSGGAVLIWDDAAPLFERCTFQGNSTGLEAGAFLNGFFASPILRDCLFLSNSSGSEGGGAIISGGALLVDSEFHENETGFGGGGLEIAGGNTSVVGCLFARNSAPNEGGGIRLVGAEAEIRDCTFVGNTAPNGGAIQLYRSGATVFNCTMYANSSGIMVGRDGYPPPSDLTLSHSIIAESTDGEAIRCAAGSSARVSCSDLSGNRGGDWVDCVSGQQGTDGNLSLAPCFCAPLAGDLTLSSNSPCAPANAPPGCGLIGAFGVGCQTPCPGSTAVEPTTWGWIKSHYR